MWGKLFGGGIGNIREGLNVVGNGWEEYGGGSVEIDGILVVLGKVELEMGVRWRLLVFYEGDELWDCLVDMVVVVVRVSRVIFVDRMDCLDYGIYIIFCN